MDWVVGEVLGQLQSILDHHNGAHAQHLAQVDSLSIGLSF